MKNKSNKNNTALDSEKYHYPTYAEIVQAHLERTGRSPSFEEKMRYQGIQVIVKEAKI